MVCFESLNFLPRSLGLGFLTRISASRRVFDFTIRHTFKGLFTRREGNRSKRVTLTLTHFTFFPLRRVFKAARVTRVSGFPFLRATVTLGGRLTFSLVNTPGRVNPPTRVNFLIAFYRPFDRALTCPG